MAKEYKLSISPNFPAPQRSRAGITIPRGEELQVELDSDQVKAIKADPEISISSVGGSSDDDTTGKPAKRTTRRRAANATDTPTPEPARKRSGLSRLRRK